MSRKSQPSSGAKAKLRFYRLPRGFHPTLPPAGALGSHSQMRPLVQPQMMDSVSPTPYGSVQKVVYRCAPQQSGSCVVGASISGSLRSPFFSFGISFIGALADGVQQETAGDAELPPHPHLVRIQGHTPGSGIDMPSQKPAVMTYRHSSA
eukprot:993439-Pyramimonas_sp.AAC.1